MYLISYTHISESHNLKIYPSETTTRKIPMIVGLRGENVGAKPQAFNGVNNDKMFRQETSLFLFHFVSERACSRHSKGCVSNVLHKHSKKWMRRTNIKLCLTSKVDIDTEAEKLQESAKVFTLLWHEGLNVHAGFKSPFGKNKKEQLSPLEKTWFVLWSSDAISSTITP